MDRKRVGTTLRTHHPFFIGIEHAIAHSVTESTGLAFEFDGHFEVLLGPEV